MRVIACDPMAAGDPVLVDLDTLLAEADVVSLHSPLTPENRGLINAATIAKMKPGTFLINTARGPLVNEADLATALHEGTLAGAALDVLSKEPPEDNPLLRAPNCLVTPHIAWATKEARARLMRIAADNLAAFLAGRPLNVVA
jgi:glycerate dehydrogenase